jgi:hypothetical protein
MTTSKSAILVSMLMCVSMSGSAEAANRKAQQMVMGFTKDQATLLAQFPALVRIDNVIRDDCAVKNQGKLATDEFCGCASAVTMGLWMSGIDPNMMPRLNQYLQNPSEGGAMAFLQYQGPELYRPVCLAGTKR